MLRVCLRLGRLRINVYNKHNFPPTSNFLPADADAKKNVEVLARPIKTFYVGVNPLKGQFSVQNNNEDT